MGLEGRVALTASVNLDWYTVADRACMLRGDPPLAFYHNHVEGMNLTCTASWPYANMLHRCYGIFVPEQASKRFWVLNNLDRRVYEGRFLRSFFTAQFVFSHVQIV